MGGALVPPVPPVSCRDLERMLADRGVTVDHTTMYRWVRRFAPELEERVRRHLRPCRGVALEPVGHDLARVAGVVPAKRSFRQALGRDDTRHPREIVPDRLKCYPGALREMKREGGLWRVTRHRRGRWLNNLVEQGHRRIKRRTGPMLGFQGFWTARRTLAGVEAVAMLAKGQVRGVSGNDMPAQRAFVHRIFGLAA